MDESTGNHPDGGLIRTHRERHVEEEGKKRGPVLSETSNGGGRWLKEHKP